MPNGGIIRDTKIFDMFEGEWIPETAIMVFVFYVSFKTKKMKCLFVLKLNKHHLDPFGTCGTIESDRRINRVYITSSGTFFP